eukprot:TRINITY_DN2706_c1_g2_i1.p1 TRINITY_DN2706_c1_g2~~TRINITY_DN2706_c1_g2_i1.p1  ORF type:complete len:1114 (+),score=420.81 TRINITY_DN2706_c1_g2_i1:127-3468(+)
MPDLQVALKFDVTKGVLVAGFVLYGIDIVMCALMLWFAKSRRVSRLFPKSLALTQFAGLCWWLSHALNHELAGMWDKAGLDCWKGQVLVRGFFFTFYVIALVCRASVIRSRWLSVDRFTSSVLAITAGLTFSYIVLCVVLNVIPQSGPVAECEVTSYQAWVFYAHQALLLVVLCVMSFALTRTIYLDTKPDYTVIHPKALNAGIEMMMAVVMIIVLSVYYFASSKPADSTASRDSIFSFVIAALLPVVVYWLQVLVITVDIGQKQPEMALFPSQVFDHATGVFTTNVANLPKLRRVQADDWERKQLHKPSPNLNDASPIPVHLAEKLFDIIIRGEVNECRDFLIKSGVELLGVPGHNGDTALHVAVDHPSLSHATRFAMVDMLVNMGASIGATNNDGRTPLHIAVSSPDSAQRLVQLMTAMKSAKLGEAGNSHMTAIINTIANDGATPLHIATKLEDMGTITTLLGLRADPFRCTVSKTFVKVEDWDTSYESSVGEVTQGKSPFLLACEIGNLAVVQQMLLCCRTCDIEQLSPFGMTPLMTACYLRHVSLAMFLLKKGANVWHTMPRSRSSRQLTVLHCCAIGGDPSVLHAVVKELKAGTPLPMGTDTDTCDRCTSISESEVSTSVVDTPMAPQSPSFQASNGLGGADSGGNNSGILPAATAAGSVQSGRSPKSSHLLDRCIQLSELGADSMPRTTLLPTPRQNAESYDDAPLPEEIQAAITTLANRDTQMLPAEKKLVALLEGSWEQQYVQPLQTIEKATAEAVAAAPDGALKDVLRQDQYQWSGQAFAAPMNEPKAKKLAAEIRQKVVNPRIDLTNVMEHKQRLQHQAAALPASDRDHLLRAVDTLCRVLALTTSHTDRSRGTQKSVEVRIRKDAGHGVLSSHFLSGSSGSGGSHPPGISSTSPPGANANSVNTIDSAHPAGTSPNSEGFEAGESLTKDIVYLTDTDSIPMHVHRYFTRTDRWSRTALHWAVLKCNLGIVYFLVVLGSSIHIHDRKSRRRKDILGFTPQQYAERLAASGNPAALSAIREAEDLKATRRNRESANQHQQQYQQQQQQQQTQRSQYAQQYSQYQQQPFQSGYAQQRGQTSQPLQGGGTPGAGFQPNPNNYRMS